MGRTIEIIKLISPYFPYIYLVIGGLKWKRLTYPFHYFLAGILVVILASLTKKFFPEMMPVLRYLGPILGLLIYGKLFAELLVELGLGRVIWVITGLIIFAIVYFMVTGEPDGYQLWVIIPYDLFMIAFMSVSIYHISTGNIKLNRSVVYLFLILIAQFLLNLFLDISLGFLKNYFSGEFVDLLMKDIVPSYNFTASIFLIYILVTAIPPVPQLSEMPDLDG